MDDFQIAQLRYELGRSPQQIAHEFDISAATVSRALQRVHQLGLVQYCLTPPTETFLSERLRDLLRRGGVRDVLVADSEGRGVVGSLAARHFEATAPEKVTLILDGGWTVRDFVNALARQTTRRLSVIPIAADPPSYSVSAYELMMFLGTKSVIYTSHKIPHLANLRPSSVLRRKLQTVRRAAKEANFVVLGLGPLMEKFTALEFVQEFGVAPKTIRREHPEITAVCGYFPLSADGKPCGLPEIDTYMPRALSLPALRTIVSTPDRQVLVLAASAEKRDAVLAAIRARMCNVLVLDKPLAIALLNRLEGGAHA